jgi:hypothetical protein
MTLDISEMSDADGNPVVSTALTDTDSFWSYHAWDDAIIFSATE